jgi:flagellar hook-length control protein FliK
MAQSSSLVLLPPRHTAQAAHSTATKAKKSSSDSTFAPKLAQAKLTTAKAAVTPPAAKPTVATLVKVPTAKTTADETEASNPEKESARNTRDEKQETASEQNGASDAPAKTPVQSSGKQAALAQSAAAVEKKPVKPTKAAVTKTSAIANPHSAANAAAKPINPMNDAGDGTNDDALEDTVTIGSGFYGSTKIVERGGAEAGDEQAEPAGEEASGTPGEASAEAATAAAVTDPQASLAAEVAGPAVVVKGTDDSTGRADTTTMLNALNAQSTSSTGVAGKATATGAASGAATPQSSFNEVNHPTIVSSIQGQLLPKGGTMSIRLDPKELGEMQVTVHMKDGAMTASFTTSNEEATKLLSRSLGQLKSGLEAAGMSVQKLHVEQGSKQDFQQRSDGESKQAPQEQQEQAQRDQQRRELMQRMLRKIAGGGDPLDLVA